MQGFFNGKSIENTVDSMSIINLTNKDKNDEKIILFASVTEGDKALEAMGLPGETGTTKGRQVTHFESHFVNDYTLLVVPDSSDIMAAHHRAALHLVPGGFLVIHDNMPMIVQIQKELEAWQGDFPAPDRVLTILLSRLTAGDGELLADIEEEVEALEEKIMKKKPENYTEKISVLRKKLMVLHRYYAGLFEALEDMEENENGLIGETQYKVLHMQTNRANRLANAVANLQEYVTRVREAYQNQLDISLNETMKLFTVITAIFLPLTLIAGWYGMNLQMPEYAISAAYPIIIAVSLAVVIGCIWYFKRNKWV